MFKRKWEYMYIYAEVGYARAYTSMHYFTFVRPVSSVHDCGLLPNELTILVQGFVAEACD